MLVSKVIALLLLLHRAYSSCTGCWQSTDERIEAIQRRILAHLGMSAPPGQQQQQQVQSNASALYSALPALRSGLRALDSGRARQESYGRGAMLQDAASRSGRAQQRPSVTEKVITFGEAGKADHARFLRMYK